jgi:DNA adenine methylase
VDESTKIRRFWKNDTAVSEPKGKYKPILRWAGSKRQLLGELVKYWPGGSTRYIEPFAGSACFFFHLVPNQAILGDLNSDLINTYRFLRRDVERVIECLRRLPTGKKAYYRIRALSPSTLTEPEQAARFIYLNKYCFNGLYRTNRRGEFNVPFGDNKGQNAIDEDAIRTAAKLLEGVRFVDGDFEHTLSFA